MYRVTEVRKIIAQEMMSLDGFFAGPGGELDWFVWDDDLKNYTIRLFDTIDTLLFGRVTYEYMAGYWPTTKEEDPAITEGMNNLPKFVFSRSLDKTDWNNSVLVKDIVPQEIEKMKRRPGRDMAIFGSGSIVSKFASLGLIDEYRIIVNPVVLGNGKPLFNGFKDRLLLELRETMTFGSGTVLLVYAPAGPQ